MQFVCVVACVVACVCGFVPVCVCACVYERKSVYVCVCVCVCVCVLYVYVYVCVLHCVALCGRQSGEKRLVKIPLQHTATHCNTLQCTATHCNTLQHTARLVITYIVNTASHCHILNTLRFVAQHPTPNGRILRAYYNTKPLNKTP